MNRYKLKNIKYFLFSCCTLFSLHIFSQDVIVGADRDKMYLPMLKNKNVALVINQTSIRNDGEYVLDFLLRQQVNVKKIFALEHGVKGIKSAGKHIADEMIGDSISVVSLYGKSKKPTSKHLENIDVVVFDIQDVGVRFYTYISSLHYIMEACAENTVECIVLDRPNPNGFYIDGPILKQEQKSFVGMHPVPVVYGMTIGEYALMINGEFWLKNKVQCSLEVIACLKYDHTTLYTLPVPPSPNLPNMESIYLYPSLCFFEGTAVSVGRGTNTPFQLFGYPKKKKGNTVFTPISKEGAKYPKFENIVCSGYSLIDSSKIVLEEKSLILRWLVDTYNTYPNTMAFFNSNLFFDKLAGNTSFREAIISGSNIDSIQSSWKNDIQAFKKMRSKYLLYKDFTE